MSTLKQVRAAFQTVLQANITSPAVNVYQRVPGNPVLPAIIVIPALAKYTVSFNRGADFWEFDLHVLVPSADDDVGQDLLDEYITGTGSRSIPAIIHANPMLGLSDVSVGIDRLTAYNFRFQAVGVDHIGATLRTTKLAVTN